MSTTISLPIEPPINTSLSVGDTVFYVSGSNGPTTELGVVVSIGYNNIKVIYDPNIVAAPVLNDFIFFSKNKTVENRGVKGYYASIQFKNYSKEEVKLFSVSAEISESSK
jgi:hypothetical protein